MSLPGSAAALIFLPRTSSIFYGMRAFDAGDTDPPRVPSGFRAVGFISEFASPDAHDSSPPVLMDPNKPAAMSRSLSVDCSLRRQAPHGRESGVTGLLLPLDTEESVDEQLGILQEKLLRSRSEGSSELRNRPACVCSTPTRGSALNSAPTPSASSMPYWKTLMQDPRAR